VKQADGKYAAGRKLGTFVLMRDAHGRADQLRGLAQKQALERVSLCIGDAGPRYAVAPEADVTVVIYNPARRGYQSVQANFAFLKGELDEAKSDAIIEALSKVLPK
jgi:hypothetical protein